MPSPEKLPKKPQNVPSLGIKRGQNDNHDHHRRGDERSRHRRRLLPKTREREASPLATPAFLVGLALYSSTAFAWVFVMRYLKLATIGAIYSVCMILMLTIMGFVFFNETLNRYEVLGIVLAIASIVLLSRFE